MNDITMHQDGGSPSTLLDPTMRPWQRRYFYQPELGRGRRGFTARGAVRARSGTERAADIAARWDAIRERETAVRRDLVWF